MSVLDLIKERHSVRNYNDVEIEEEKRKIITDLIEEVNQKYDLHIQVFFDESDCFKGFLAKYGKFSGVKNYISLVGCDEEKLGYFGEMIVLKLQGLGLRSCFVGLTHGSSKALKQKGEKEHCLISFGYPLKEGVSHKIKNITDVSNYNDKMPSWFKEGVEAALFAPTAMNQQKFYITYVDENHIEFKKGIGFYTKLDLGIVKYNFDAITKKSSL